MPDQTSNKGRLKPPQNIPPAGFRCLPVNIPDDNEYIAALTGVVSKLARTSTWEFTDPQAQHDTAAIWDDVLRQMLARLADGTGCEAEICEDGSCTQIGAFHPALTYYPNNPITQPDYSGPYQTPIWGTGAGYIGATGSDAMIDVFAYATQNLTDMLTGAILPRVTLNFSGSGEIDVQFLSTIQGGAVWGYPDGNPLLGDLVSLEYTDIFSLAGTATLIEFFELVLQSDAEAFVITHSFVFETEGPHTLTLLFFPTAELEPPFIGAGGGIRSIQLCGNATVEGTEVEPVDIIIDGGKLRATVDDVPVGVGVDLENIADLIDRWVDTTGDTMTGVLTHDREGIAQYFAYGGNVVANTQIQAAQILNSFYEAAGWMIRGNGTNGPEFRLNDSNIIFRSPRTSAYPLAGRILFAANHATTAVAIRNNHPTGDNLRLYDDLNVLRIAMQQSGELLGKTFEGWGYSSVGTWQQQMSLSGEWQVDTDAMRQGNAVLKISGYDGDHEIIRALYNQAGDNHNVRFFGGEGEGFRPAIINYANQEELTWALAETLKQYHLLEDYQVAGAPSEIEEIGLTDLEKCNAAYFLAGFIAAVIGEFFDNLYTVTYQEQITGMIDGYDIPASIAIQILAALEQTYTSLTDINSDLSDPAVIANMLLEADFHKGAFYTAIEAYAWIEPLSVDLLEQVLDGFWPNVGSYLAIGSQTDQGACAGYPFSCGEDISIDFRDGLLHGVEMVAGAVELGTGLLETFDGSNYRIAAHINFGQDVDCDIASVRVTGYKDHGNEPTVEFWLYRWDGSSYVGGGPFYVVQAPYGSYDVTVNLPGGTQPADRILILRPSYPTAHPGDRIATVHVTVAG